MDSSTEQIHKWAAQKICVDADQIDHVFIDMMNGDEGCPTCGPDPAYIKVYIYRKGDTFKSATAYTYNDPTALIREICEA